MSARPSAREGRIRDDLADVVSSLGLVVEDVSVMPAGKRRVVRVLVDRDLSDLGPDDTTSAVPPLDLDQVAEATRAVSERLDTADHMGDASYVLEVSSPGTDRPLTQPRHFRRNVGRLVTMTTVQGQNLTGRLLSVGADVIRVRVDRGKGATSESEVALRDVTRAHVEIEFNRPDTVTGDADDQGEDD